MVQSGFRVDDYIRKSGIIRSVPFKVVRIIFKASLQLAAISPFGPSRQE